MKPRQRGFTLIEVMVAVLVSAILAMMAFGAMQQALQNRDRIRANAARLQALQFTVRSLVQDFSQLTPRPIREPLGPEYLNALTFAVNIPEVQLTRAGWMNPAGVGRSTLQRVRYVLRDGSLYRDYWMALDPQLQPAPASRVILDRVKGFSLRFMNDARRWQESWPPPTPGGPPTDRERRWRPVAVEVTIELEDWGRVTRVIEVAG